MVSVELLGFEGVQTLISAIEEKAKAPELFDKIGNYMHSSIKKKIDGQKFKEPFTPTSKFTKDLRRGSDTSKGKTLQDNGMLYNSIQKKVEVNSIKIGSQLKYAKIHNEGGTVTAKKNYLYIPGTPEIKKNSQANGVSATIELFKSKGYNVFYNKTGRGNVLLYQRIGKRKEFPVQVMFYLKKSVTIPKREYLYVSDEDEKIIQGIIKRYLFSGVK